MKILVSLSYYLPNISGLTIYAQNLAEEMAGRGHEVTVLTSQHQKVLPREEIINSVKVVRVPVTFQLGKGPIMIQFLLKAFRYIKKVDVVNPHLPQFESFILAIIAKAKRKRVVLTYQTDLSWNGSLLLKISKIFILISNFISAILADRIVVLSKDYVRHSWFLSLFSKKLVYIYPPVKLIEPNKMTSKIFEKRMELKQKYVIGVVARISPEKGIEYLLETIPLLINKLESNFIIVIAGPPSPIGENDYANKIEILFNKYNKFVKFVGQLNDEELTCFYKSLGVLVLPSVNSTEAFGMVQVEAMFCGVPVVASNLPGVRIPVRMSGMGEIAKVKDAKDLAEKIIKVLTNKKNYVKEKKVVEKIFNFKSTIDKYEKLFT